MDIPTIYTKPQNGSEAARGHHGGGGKKGKGGKNDKKGGGQQNTINPEDSAAVQMHSHDTGMLE